MEAGQELDALVAEKVMGFCLHRPGYTYDLTHAECECKRCGEMIVDYVFEQQRSFRPSIDIAVAWQVVEKLGLAVTPCLNEAGERDGWCAAFGEWYGSSFETTQIVGCADTAPLAICQAALSLVQTEATA